MMTEKQVAQAMESSKQMFEQKQIELQRVVDEYNEKLTSIKTEGNNKIKELEAELEQIRGTYTAYFYMLHPEAVPQPNKPEGVVENTEVNNEQVVKSEETKMENPYLDDEETTIKEEPKIVKATGLEDKEIEKVVMPEKEHKQLTDKQPEIPADAVTNLKQQENNNGLTQEELDKLHTMAQEKREKLKKSKELEKQLEQQEDIPEYLRDEYNK